MKYNIPDRVLKDIYTAAEKHGTDRIVLFGSRARGDHTERSDIDIAVSGGDFDAFYWDIKDNVHSLLMFDVIDLGSGISDDLKTEIDREGVLIYEKT